MRAYVLPPLVIAAAFTVALLLLYLLLPVIGPERAVQAMYAARTVCLVSLAVGAGWTVWKLLGRSRAGRGATGAEGRRLGR